MQALAFGFSMNKVMRKLYKDDPDELQAAMTRHTSMFNTNCDWGSIIHGIVISLEEQRSKGAEEITPDMIESIKIGLMGPLAGIGDSVDQGIVATIPLAIFVPMALEGSVAAAFIPGIIYVVWSMLWSWFLFRKGYSMGRSAVTDILHSGTIKKVIDVATIVGIFMVAAYLPPMSSSPAWQRLAALRFSRFLIPCCPSSCRLQSLWACTSTLRSVVPTTCELSLSR